MREKESYSAFEFVLLCCEVLTKVSDVVCADVIMKNRRVEKEFDGSEKKFN